MSSKSGPHHGDLLVSQRIVPERRPVYDISIVPGPAQLSMENRAQAIAKAFEFSAARGVDAWSMGRGGRYSKLTGPKPL